ncbi:MAG TPA: EamA family transporter [Bryobacteraceae bacterium]|jgi:undecaprenyl phosphate-alpha-L-ara4N flippase subunit ArnE|nr:EamA family transporter [Bryobacteraceae bacterium]
MSRTPLSSIALVLLASLIGSFGAVFLKMGAAHLNRGFRYIVNWQLALGIALFVGSSVPFLMGLRHGELSVLYPMVSLSYVCALFWSKLFFNESITKAKVGALMLILAGIVCIGIGGQ